MTKMERIEMAIAMVEERVAAEVEGKAEVMELLEGLKTAELKRAEARLSSPKAKANEALMAEILAVMGEAEAESMRAKEVAAALEAKGIVDEEKEAPFSTNKVAAMLKKLVEADKVRREGDKKTTFFALV